MKHDDSRHVGAFPAAVQPFAVHVSVSFADMGDEPRWLTPAVVEISGCPEGLLDDVTKLARKELCSMERDVRHNSATQMHLLAVTFDMEVTVKGVVVTDKKMRVLDGKTFRKKNVILTDEQEIDARAKWLKANLETHSGARAA